MVYTRIKIINGDAYAYRCKSKWYKRIKASRQKVIKYLGKVSGLGKLDAKALFEREQQCAKCHTDQNLTVDHIKPLSKGGTNDQSNIQVLCKGCNAQKGITHD